MDKPSYSEIKRNLESADIAENKKALLYLHKQVFHLVSNFVTYASGKREDAEDTFQEGLYILIKMAKQNKLPAELNPEAYLFIICKNLWKKHLIKTGNKIKLVDEFPTIAVEETPMKKILGKEKKEALQAIIAQLGADCQQLLLYFYYEKKSMKAIARLFGYSGEAVAKNKKSKCMKKLRSIVFSSKSKTDFFLD